MKHIRHISTTTFQEREASSTTSKNSDMESKLDGDIPAKKRSISSSWKGEGGRDIPLIEVELKNVTYQPFTKTAGMGASSATRQRKTILNRISTRIAPYQLTAWMGPSGSGKTSLISVAADLIHSGDLSDDSLITVNGEEGRIPKRLVGVVWQDDLLLSNLTVEENVFFAARLKTPETTTDAVVRKIVDETLEELGLFHRRDSLVGNPLLGIRGISGGERRRLAIATELVARPSLLLLDEPTSGLDATTAQSLIVTLKDLARQGHSVAVVIHQPRTAIFNSFDHLLLLSQGHMIYDGEPCKVRTFLEACPVVGELPPETGIADWIMDLIIEDEARQSERQLVNHHMSHSVQDGRNQAIHLGTADRKLDRRLSSLNELHSAPRFATGFFTQLRWLTHRTIKQQRGERLTVSTLILQFVYLFFTALFWWRLPNSTANIFERNSLLFFMMIAQANSVVINAVTVFQRERTLLYRERAKKLYGVSSYFLAKTMSDMSTNVILPSLYCMCVYWTANFRPTGQAYLRFILAMYMSFSTAQSMGLVLSILIPTTQLALVLAPPITLFFMILGGFYIPLENMHVGIKWATWLSFARYGYIALLVNEYAERNIPCGGERNAPIQIGVTDQCPLPGEEVLASMGISGLSEEYWFNISMMILLQVVFRVSAYVSLRRTK